MPPVLIAYLIVINLVTLLAFIIDKKKAKRSKWRIPEATLLGLAVLGGSIGAWLGMRIWRHKTLHNKFRFGIPVIILLQLALVLYLYYRH